MEKTSRPKDTSSRKLYQRVDHLVLDIEEMLQEHAELSELERGAIELAQEIIQTVAWLRADLAGPAQGKGMALLRFRRSRCRRHQPLLPHRQLQAPLHRARGHYLAEVIRIVPYWPRERYLELAPAYWARTRERLDAKQLAAELGPITVPPFEAPSTEQPPPD